MYLLSYRKSQSDYFILIHFITNQPIMQIKNPFTTALWKIKQKKTTNMESAITI